MIECMVGPLHETVVTAFGRAVEHAREALPASDRPGIFITTGLDYNSFSGKYAGSYKTADFLLMREKDGINEPYFVIEVGFSESYEDLVNDAKLWLEGNEKVFSVFLIKIKESPAYRCPAGHLSSSALERMGFSKPFDINDTHFSVKGEYGPVTWNTLRWVGKISTVAVEAWQRDHDGLAMKTQDCVGPSARRE
jgi:hypothetical protein